MAADDFERITPLGFFDYGASYRAAADKLRWCKHKSTHPHAPVHFLYYHAIELFLKAFLRAHDVSVKDLKDIGHRFDKLRTRAVALGLHLVQADSQVIEFIGGGDLWSQSRYLVVGFKCQPGLGELSRACRRLDHSVAASLVARGIRIRRYRLRSKGVKLTD
jgi:hypothetical protein